MSKYHVRQGDVLLFRIGDVKPTGKPVASRRVVLALGEVTGHAHVVEGAVAEFVSAEGNRLLWVEASAPIVHEEHDAVTLKPGLWRLGIQMEQTAEDVRRVMD